jgi:hypothetical protein
MSKLQEIQGKGHEWTLSDKLDSDDSEKPFDKNENSMAFSASVISGGESNVSASLDLGESSQNDSDNEDDLQVGFTKLFEECMKLKKLNTKTFKKVNGVELENENLLS